MKPKIALIDYGMGNLRSVSKALEKAGCDVLWVRKPEQLRSRGVMVLPGVGAFSVAVKNLKARKLFEPVRKWILEGRPFLGICLGYQLLFEKGEEGRGKSCRGLGVFKGRVRRFPVRPGLRVPHIGWNGVRFDKSSAVFKGLKPGSFFYFVHSFFPEPEASGLTASRTDYGLKFAASVERDNLFACQFHPEKSGANGLRLLKNFVGAVRA